MPTQQPLKNLVKDIVDYVERHKDNLTYNNRLTLIHEGQLYNEVVESLRSEFKPETVENIKHRIPCINVLDRIIDKLSRAYQEPVSRSTSNETDAELIEFFEKEYELDETMAWANRLFNLHQCCALEPYLESDGSPKLRVLSADEFLVWSDDLNDPTRPTVFIKFMGKVEPYKNFTNNRGRYIKPNEESRVNLYYLYSDNEFLIVDSDEEIRVDLMGQLNQNGLNPVGVIPFIYLNQSKSRLVPLPDTDMLENTLLIPKLLADLNYAVKHLSHTKTVAIDLQLPDDIPNNPDSIWSLNTVPDSDKSGSLQIVKPEVDVEKVLELIQSTLAIWLEAKNLRPGTMGKPMSNSRVPALAKIIDEADATAVRTQQVNYFMKVEKRLFTLTSKLQKLWSKTVNAKESRVFTSSFEMSAAFPEQRPYTTEQQRIESAALMQNAGLMTKRQALRKIYPAMSDKELDEWLQELDRELINDAPKTVRKTVEESITEGTDQNYTE